jgi:hypothetical protein
MVSENTRSIMVIVTKGTGEIMSLVERAYLDGPMDQSILVIGKMAGVMGWESLLFQMDSSTMVCG